MSGDLGKIKALAETAAEDVKRMHGMLEQFQHLQTRIERTMNELEELRELKFEIEDLVERARRPAWAKSTELGKMLDVHEATIRRWYREGKIRGHQIEENGHIRFDLEEVKEDIRALPAP